MTIDNNLFLFFNNILCFVDFHYIPWKLIITMFFQISLKTIIESNHKILFSCSVKSRFDVLKFVKQHNVSLQSYPLIFHHSMRLINFHHKW